MTSDTINDAVTMAGGEAVLGRIDTYELVRELGEGGFEAVYLAKDLGLAAEIRSSMGRLKSRYCNGMLQGGQVQTVMKKAISKLVLGICVITMLDGCSSARCSFRYGDGSPYNVSANYKPTQKFFVRSIEFVNGNGASIPASELPKKLPKLFDSEYNDGDIPIKIVIRYGEWRKVPQDLYSLFSLLSLTIIPWESVFEIYADVDILTDDGEAVVPPARYMEVSYEKTSYLLFFGSGTYGAKEGFQFNYSGATLGSIKSNKECIGFFVNCVACCIAQQLEKYALDRITAPEINFE